MSKIKLPKLKFHTRTIIAGAFVLLICAAAYTDSKLNGDELSASAEYLYTAGTENENQNAKILGEAAFVDSIMSPDENGRVGESISTEASSDESAQASTYDTYFSAMQVDRQKSRREACEILQTVVDSADSMPDVKERAYEEMMAIAGNIEIENNVYIGTGTTLFGHTGLYIGAYSLIAQNVTCTPYSHIFDDPESRIYGQGGHSQKVSIGPDAYIGMGVDIMYSGSVGKGSVVGSGAVVVKPIPPYSVAVGNPAKVIKERK